MPEETKGGGGQCETCLQRKSPYPANLKNSDSGSSWSFWGKAKSTTNNVNQSCGCGATKNDCAPAKEACAIVDPCKNNDEKCGKEDNACKKLSTEFKQPSNGCCPPMPPSQIPALCKPAWLKCPASITIALYPAPKGVEIRPISEGGRNNKCQGGKCGKCGMTSPPSGPPKVSPTCPMMRPKCPTAKNKAGETEGDKKGGILSRITSWFSFGGKDKAEGGKPKAEKKRSEGGGGGGD